MYKDFTNYFKIPLTETPFDAKKAHFCAKQTNLRQKQANFI